MGISINRSGASYNLVSGSNFSEITAPFAKGQKKKKFNPIFNLQNSSPFILKEIQ